jgi:hypothetical protein
MTPFPSKSMVNSTGSRFVHSCNSKSPGESNIDTSGCSELQWWRHSNPKAKQIKRDRDSFIVVIRNCQSCESNSIRYIVRTVSAEWYTGFFGLTMMLSFPSKSMVNNMVSWLMLSFPSKSIVNNMGSWLFHSCNSISPRNRYLAVRRKVDFVLTLVSNYSLLVIW